MFSIFVVIQAAHDGILTELHDILRKSGTLKLIDLLDSNSYAPLHCAVRGNHTECVQLLLEYGAGQYSESILTMQS